MKTPTTVSCSSREKIFSYYFRFRGLCNSRGLDSLQERQSLYSARMRRVHERHRSSFASPSRSPHRSGKCPRDERLLMPRQSIWARAKHRVGLEDPTFAHGFVAKVMLGVAPAHEILFDVLPARAAGFWTKQVKDEVDSGEGGKNYDLLFRYCQLLHSMLGPRSWFSSLCNHRLRESHRTKKSIRHSAPTRIVRLRWAAPRICQTTRLTVCTNKKGEASCPF